MAEPVTVRYGDRTFALDAASLISIDVEGMVDEALRPRSEAALPERVVQRALGDPAGAAVPVDVAVDHAALEAWVAAVAAEIDTAPVDATMTLSGDRLEVVAARAGKTVDRAAAVAALGEALVTGGKEVPLTVTTTDPAVAEGDLGAAILVDLSERRLYLYRAGAEEKTYGVAIGTASHPTPRGSFRIVQKRYMPSWGNPGSAWAAGMPDYIPPGPSNPLGTRALNLDVSGIRIHGTSNNGSIGTAASHGCMRMHRWDIEDLYERVDVGTPVYIVR
jgi:lipoprotein-anchoring transpeptidase ErfK/SrfK